VESLGTIAAQDANNVSITGGTIDSKSVANLVATDSTQTLTNKTLTNPVLSGNVSGTYTIGGTPTFPSTVVSTTGTQTLTNKTMTTPTINGCAMSGTWSGTPTFSGSITHTAAPIWSRTSDGRILDIMWQAAVAGGMRVTESSGFYFITVENGTSGNVSGGVIIKANNQGLVHDGVQFYGGDNAVALGFSGGRYTQLFAVSGTINTSDEREKEQIRALTENEIACACALTKKISAYKWIHAVQKKNDEARTHIGFIAQEVIDVMQNFGLDAFKYGFVCYDEWESKTMPTEISAGNRYGIRYDELMCFIAAGFEARLSALEISTLNNK
jgi:hypothetical protein